MAAAKHISTCSLCPRPLKYVAQRLCGAHYARISRTGTAELRPWNRDPRVRLLERVLRFDVDTGCWIWGGYIDARSGYGQLSTTGFKAGTYAHRLSYAAFVGPIPAGLHIDHLCRMRLCVNPWHLQPVSIKENVLRGVGVTAQNARKTHCVNGHEFSANNTRWRPRPNGSMVRNCRICTRATEARANLRRAEASPAVMKRRLASLKGYGR